MMDLLKLRHMRDQEIGKRIQALLIVRHMQQKDLATAIGVVDSTISLYLHGSVHITPGRLQQIANVLDVTVEDLTEGT